MVPHHIAIVSLRGVVEAMTQLSFTSFRALLVPKISGPRFKDLPPCEPPSAPYFLKTMIFKLFPARHSWALMKSMGSAEIRWAHDRPSDLRTLPCWHPCGPFLAPQLSRTLVLKICAANL